MKTIIKTRICHITLCCLFCASASAQTLNSFFAVHCVYNPSNGETFENLKKLVDTATFNGIPLTLEMNFKFIDHINTNPAWLATVRTWQQQGHEIGLLNLSCNHQNWRESGGYTNDSACFNDGIRLGNINDFFQKYRTVAGDSALLTAAVSDYQKDWILPVPYQTSGEADNIAAAFATPKRQTYTTTLGTAMPCRIDYTFLRDQSTVTELQRLYAAYKPPTTLGVATHIRDYARSPQTVIAWFRFIRGKNCKTVRTILREQPCAAGSTGVVSSLAEKKILVSPNPASNLVSIHFSIEQSQHVSLRVFNVLGQEITTILDETLPAGEHRKSLDVGDWSLVSQTLFVQLRTQNSTLKTLPLRVIR